MLGISLPVQWNETVLFMAGAWLFLAIVFVVVFLALLRAERTRAELSAQMARLADVSDRLADQQANLQGRLAQTQLGVNDRLDALARHLGDTLTDHGQRTGETLRGLHERLGAIDAAQRTIARLSDQVVSLQEILANKQARGAFGEVQLQDLVSALMPPGAFTLQATLGNRNRVDCLLKLPDPPGPMAIDAKFPLEGYRALREARDDAAKVRAGRTFAADVLKHVRDIAERYIVPGETADSALMFLPSEAVYAELHASFPAVVEEAWRRKVWIVSPTTLWATLNTLRAVLRDVHLRQQASLLQADLQVLSTDVSALAAKASALQRHFEQTQDDVRAIRALADKIAHTGGRLDFTQLSEPAPRADADTASPPV
ncbi:Recombinase RmuC [Candidatus Defluviicoccus seviourii]|uniref:DNA recombination protein RmuC homolog n=1 Tax=Candidatus Defluviicoccus seviourii TaxID=2565273 RepID=A0A564WGB6_9PROT|nr:Recombinase RmuC [Candidatus Defluviicoccus seviourii]